MLLDEPVLHLDALAKHAAAFLACLAPQRGSSTSFTASSLKSRLNGFLAAIDYVWDVPGYRTELTPFGGIKNSGLGYKEGVREAIKGYTNIKTFSVPWL
jgi:acyl-CoA reductase-like NAD-dependent aldehyde dehydrogenase